MAGRIVPGRLAAAQCSRSILDLIDPFSIEFLGYQMMTSDWQSPHQRYVAEHLQAQVTPKGKVLSLDGFMNLSALAEPRPGYAVSGLTEANVALTRCGLGSPSDHLRRSFVPAFPRGTPPSDPL